MGIIAGKDRERNEENWTAQRVQDLAGHLGEAGGATLTHTNLPCDPQRAASSSGRCRSLWCRRMPVLAGQGRSWGDRQHSEPCHGLVLLAGPDWSTAHHHQGAQPRPDTAPLPQQHREHRITPADLEASQMHPPTSYSTRAQHPREPWHTIPCSVSREDRESPGCTAAPLTGPGRAEGP